MIKGNIPNDKSGAEKYSQGYKDALIELKNDVMDASLKEVWQVTALAITKIEEVNELMEG